MNAKQAENLRILIEHMETKVTRTLNMVRIANGCGTPACAMGEACMIEGFGLSFPRGSTYVLQLNGEATDLQQAADTVFGVHYARLFSGSLHGHSDVTPQEWAAEARKVLVENGYRMDDGFAAFRAKVLAPVDLPETREDVACWPKVAS